MGGENLTLANNYIPRAIIAVSRYTGTVQHTIVLPYAPAYYLGDLMRFRFDTFGAFSMSVRYSMLILFVSFSLSLSRYNLYCLLL